MNVINATSMNVGGKAVGVVEIKGWSLGKGHCCTCRCFILNCYTLVITLLS